jgi:hypothetical protein
MQSGLSERMYEKPGSTAIVTCYATAHFFDLQVWLLPISATNNITPAYLMMKVRFISWKLTFLNFLYTMWQ